MKCPKCNKGTQVLDSRPDGQSVNRRRKCKGCGHRFNTAETIIVETKTFRPKQTTPPPEKKAAPVKSSLPVNNDLDDIWDDLSNAGDGVSLRELGLD